MHDCRSSRRELRQLNKSLRICDIRLTTSDIAFGSYICLCQVKDLFNITLAKTKISRKTCFAYHF